MRQLTILEQAAEGSRRLGGTSDYIDDRSMGYRRPATGLRGYFELAKILRGQADEQHGKGPEILDLIPFALTMVYWRKRQAYNLTVPRQRRGRER